MQPVNRSKKIFGRREAQETQTKCLSVFQLCSDVTEMQISAGEPARVLTIRTKSQFANQLLDIVLDRVILQVESEPQTGEEPQVESEMDPGEHLRGERGSGPMKGRCFGTEPPFVQTVNITPASEKLNLFL